MSSAIEVTRIRSRSALVAAAEGDAFVASSVPLTDDVEAWAVGSDVAWLSSSRRRGVSWLSIVADPAIAPLLVQAVAHETDTRFSGLTLPAAALPRLAETFRPTEYNLWDWFFTTSPPPSQPGEDAVVWAGPSDEPGITSLIDNDSPRHSARPGDRDVLRWCVVRDHDGRLAACAALTEHVPGVAHLASIVTRTDQRGRGLGRAITAWITRRLLEEGRPLVTLGMYADNDVARRLYRDLGYVDLHHFASGFLPGRRLDGDADPVHDEAD